MSRCDVEFPFGGEFVTTQLELVASLGVPMAAFVGEGKGRTDVTWALDGDGAMSAAILDLPLF